MAGHDPSNEHKFDLTKGEFVTLLECVKKEQSICWFDPRTWIYLWYSQYEIEIQWTSRFMLDLTYVDVITRSHLGGEAMSVTLVPTFFRSNPNAIEESECTIEACKTTVTVQGTGQVHFSLSIKLTA